MKKTIIGLVVAAACGFCVSNANADLLLDWVNGTLSTTATGVSGSPSTIPNYTLTSSTASAFDALTFTLIITAASGYDLSGLTAVYTHSISGDLSTTMTYGGTGYASGGPDSLSGPSSGVAGSSITLHDVTSGSSETLTFT